MNKQDLIDFDLKYQKEKEQKKMLLWPSMPYLAESFQD